MATPWVRTTWQAKWHRVKVMSIERPYITTKCGRHPDEPFEYLYDPKDALPVGMTCRVCVPIVGRGAPLPERKRVA
jgi:hypothetical protein